MRDRFLLRIAYAHGFLKKLWVLTRPYWFAADRAAIGTGMLSITVKESTVARLLLGLIVFLSVLIVYMSKLLNAWNARFFNAIQQKDAHAFWHELIYWTVLVAVFIIAFVYRQWLQQLLGIRWRRWLSEVYFRDWLADRTYYRMELDNHGADNPEQRIEQDCNSFVTQTLNIVLGLLLQVMTIATFASVLYELSGGFVLPVFGGIAVPGYMMWMAFAYALLGSVITYFVGRPLVRVNFELERYNADFRYRMIRIRENSESIALFRGEHDEERRLRDAFGRIYTTWWQYMKCTRRLTWLTAFYGQAAAIFPIIVAAPRYFAGQIELGTLTQTADAFGQVQGSLSWFVDTYSTLAAWKAVLDRLTTFSDAMLRAKVATANTGFAIDARNAPELVLRDVAVQLPNGRPLLDNVDMTIKRGESVTLQGASGSGKTTLFRVLAGLWPYGRGHVTMPAGARVFFLAQKPYLPIGTLKEALSYPHAPTVYEDDQYNDVLDACGLAHLAPRLEESSNWSLVLSGGEQQRLAVGRALLYRPEWLFLDEATSALEPAAEERLHALLMRRLPEATLIIITHRQAPQLPTRRVIAIDPVTRHLQKQPLAHTEASP